MSDYPSAPLSFDPIGAPVDQPNDRDDLVLTIARLKEENERLDTNGQGFRSRNMELLQQIKNVRGYIMGLDSFEGSISDEVEAIAGYLDIELTKQIQGTATFEISWTATVPLGFEADDIELSFDVECDNDFDWQEINTEVTAEDSE